MHDLKHVLQVSKSYFRRKAYFSGLMSKSAMINFLNMKILSAVIGICKKKKRKKMLVRIQFPKLIGYIVTIGMEICIIFRRKFSCYTKILSFLSRNFKYIRLKIQGQDFLYENKIYGYSLKSTVGICSASVFT